MRDRLAAGRDRRSSHLVRIAPPVLQRSRRTWTRSPGVRQASFIMLWSWRTLIRRPEASGAVGVGDDRGRRRPPRHLALGQVDKLEPAGAIHAGAGSRQPLATRAGAAARAMRAAPVPSTTRSCLVRVKRLSPPWFCRRPKDVYEGQPGSVITPMGYVVLRRWRAGLPAGHSGISEKEWEWRCTRGSMDGTGSG